MVWDNMNVMRGHDEFYDMEDLHKAYEDGRKQGWREAMEEAQKSGYGQRENYPPQGGGFDPNAYGQRRGVKGTGPYSRMR